MSIRGGILLANIRNKLESELHVYYKLFVILYADDTVILSESKDEQVLEIVHTYAYLGVIFKYNGTFLETKKKLVEQAEKALYCVYKLARKETLPVDIQLLLFYSMIEPILIYGSEVWGYENLKFIEQIHLKYCKRVLQVRNTTPNFMVLGELGRFPIEVKVKLKMISFWSRLIVNQN